MSKQQRIAGLIYGPERHHIDHLAPLALILQMSLIVTDEEVAKEASAYYPGLNLIHIDYLQLPDRLVQDYEVIFCSMPRLLFDEIFFFSQQLLRKKVQTVWCPHGNSDKGSTSYFMEALQKEKIALVYGQKMIDFFIAKGVLSRLKAYVITGNYRYHFYRKNKAFYDAILKEKITRKLSDSLRTILYAPTWQDLEKSSSFFSACEILIDQLPESSNLIVKLHPNLALQDEHRVNHLIWKYEGHPRVLFLREFPPIYPLLDFVDVYVGDMSSIGYDFLFFNKPMFFLNENKRDPKSDPGLYLYRCGVEIRPEQYQNIYSLIDAHLATDGRDFSQIRKETYAYTFGKEKSLETLRTEILDSLKHLPDDDLGLF